MPERRERSRLLEEASAIIPGTLSLRTLEMLTENAKRMGWFSLKDEGLRQIIRIEGERLPNLGLVGAQEVNDAVTYYEERLDEKNRKNSFTKQHLSAYKYGAEKRVIRVGNTVPPRFAPIPDDISQAVICSIVGYPDKPDLKKLIKSKGDLDHARDNIEVLRVLFGTEILLPKWLERYFH